jgi:hypothetical protein
VRRQLLEMNGGLLSGITELLAQHNVQKRERTRDKLFSEIEDAVAVLVQVARFATSGAGANRATGCGRLLPPQVPRNVAAGHEKRLHAILDEGHKLFGERS